MASESNTILHVCVIGFHHKKGCQLEYAYPPLIEGNPVDSHELPEAWKHLPSLALPDGAHNFDQDTIYFHLRSNSRSQATVFGVSCYRQIAAKDLIHKTADVTRSTVQKSVCVISALPLYGLIQAKLELITLAYFKERDFSKVELLQAMYNSLNMQVTASHIRSQAFLGMSARDLVLKYRHKILVLFKLILLERKVLFFMSPVCELNNVMLALVSLFPGMIEHGLLEAAGTDTRKLSSTVRVDSVGSDFVDVTFTPHDNDGLAISNTPDIIKSHQPKLKLNMPSANLGSTHFIEKTPTNGNSENKTTTPSSAGARTADSVFFNTSHDFPGKAVQIPSKPITTQPGFTPPIPHRPSLACIHTSAHHPEKFSSTAEDDDHTACVHCKNIDGTQSYLKSSDSTITDNKHKNSAKNLMLDFQKTDGNSTFYMPSNSEHSSLPVTPLLFNDVSLDDITRKEAIQEVSQAMSADIETEVGNNKIGSITKITSQNDKHRTKPEQESEFCDLDSPESINEIDREDGFSWEEEKLLLEIEAELEDDTLCKNSEKITDDKSHGKKNSDEDLSVINTENSDHEDKIINICQSNLHELSMPDSEIPPATACDKPIDENLSTSPMHTRAAFIRSKFNAKPKVLQDDKLEARPPSPTTLTQDSSGFPLSIFTKGSVCHPYLPLQYFSILDDIDIRSFVIGATNILFKQRRHLTDVVIGECETNIDIHDPELRRALSLSTADLRFADVLVKNVLGESADELYLDGTDYFTHLVGWEGGEEWIRVQFRNYLTSLLASVKYGDEKLWEDFNLHFVRALKTTHNYRIWSSSHQNGVTDIHCGHPSRGQIGIGDMKLRLQHSMQSTEKGRKIMQSTGHVVNKTGKVVESAFSQAKTAVSGWFSYLKPQQQQAIESESLTD